MLGNLHDMITAAASSFVSVCLCLCISVCERKRRRGGVGGVGTRGTGFSGNVLLNICEIDDTHLKQLERDGGRGA